MKLSFESVDFSLEVSDHLAAAFIHEFRRLIETAYGCKTKPGPDFWHLKMVAGSDEPIPTGPQMSRLTLPGGKLAPGFRRKFTLTYDKPVDLMDDQAYLQTEPVEGDSTITIIEATANGAVIWVNGDGAVGDKVNSVRVDGHVGAGDVPIVLELAFTVGSDDATEITVAPTTEPDEAIPG